MDGGGQVVRRRTCALMCWSCVKFRFWLLLCLILFEAKILWVFYAVIFQGKRVNLLFFLSYVSFLFCKFCIFMVNVYIHSSVFKFYART